MPIVYNNLQYVQQNSSTPGIQPIRTAQRDYIGTGLSGLHQTSTGLQ